MLTKPNENAAVLLFHHLIKSLVLLCVKMTSGYDKQNIKDIQDYRETEDSPVKVSPN